MESIQIILSKDSDGKDINLLNMSLDETKSLRQILDAFIKIVEHEADLNLKIGVKQGSAVPLMLSPDNQMEVVYNKIKDAHENSPERDNLYVNELNVIRDVIDDKFDFDIVYNRESSVKESLKPLFTKRFRNRRVRRVYRNDFSVKFIDGWLEQNGGVKPNFHLVVNDEKITIQCNHEEARKVNPFLYNEIKISAWTKDKNGRIQYSFCDIYAGKSEDYYYDFKKFFNELKDKKGTEPFHLISEKLEGFYDGQNYSGAKKFIRVFLSNYASPVYLRTILVISKGFKDHEDLSEILAEVENKLTLKIGKVY
ncbi:hypothetical protein KFZ70_05035 [Tamlana fucoidanivorans]|uniref:Uncharacterized protein n=1 Tax=Allotamlana fucoidanivorans TaxID=2583814 RepID=A0A5C4STM3_9FLAO|nr:hypothetical protein [Tamlana fucoidanivorans]TNJ47119.1 hypothetical protein FGF67_00940 [Tamlana fucoidanivorans]